MPLTPPPAATRTLASFTPRDHPPDGLAYDLVKRWIRRNLAGRLQGGMPLVGLDNHQRPQRYAEVLAETGQRVQLSRTEKLLWAAALVPDDAEAQALFAKAREFAAKDRPSVRMRAIY